MIAARPFRVLTACLALSVLSFGTARGVIIDTGTGRNLTPAPNGLDRFVGNLDYGTTHVEGIAIAPQYFITARHVVSGDPGTFTINGVVHSLALDGNNKAITFTNSNAFDLIIVKIADSFKPTEIAPLYTGGAEVGLAATILGRGVARGAAQSTPIPGGGTRLNGWYSGTNDRARSWGTGTAHRIETDVVSGTRRYGDILDMDFIPGQTSSLTNNDSGGGFFVNDGGTWKLAGVNFARDSDWSTSPTTNYLPGTMFDARGLYLGSPSNHTFFDPSLPDPVRGTSYFSRISSNVGWISGVTGVVPEPSGVVLSGLGLLVGIGYTAGRRRRVRAS